MGTSLTGLTPSTTYDALIKVGDNGPLSATAKYIGDGLGNDSVLALSTDKVGIGTSSPDHTLQVNGNVLFKNSLNNALAFFAKEADDSGTLYLYNNGTLKNVIASNGTSYFNAGNVGIGTSSPDIFSRFYTRSVGIDSNGITKIQLNGTTYSGIDMGQGGTRYAELNTGSSGLDISTIGALPIRFYPNGANRVTVTTDGLTFNGDTAAANALDDYEEGTWTPNISFGGASVGVTYGASNGGTYTKIGRQVSVNAYLDISNKGTSTGSASIGNLPFTIGSGASNYGVPSFRPVGISFADFFMGYGDVNTNKIDLQETTNLGVTSSLTDADFSTATNIILSFTYFV